MHVHRGGMGWSAMLRGSSGWNGKKEPGPCESETVMGVRVSGGGGG